MTGEWTYAKDVLGKRPYSFIVWPLSMLYALIATAVYAYIYRGSLGIFFHNPLPYTIATIILTLMTSVLFGVFLTLFIAKIKELRVKSAGFGFLALLFGGLAIGCPGCAFGLFPLLLGTIGIGGTLALLPLKGVEFQLIAIVFLPFGIRSLAKESAIACKPRKGRRR